ncbi:MAG: calcium:proton antiporter [Gammaproteobacteria bacterium]
MNSRSTLPTAPKRRATEWAFPVALAILVVGWVFKPALSAGALPGAALIGAFVGFFIGALVAAFAAVRHAEYLAHRFGEPYGTLILALSAISLEVETVVTVMLTGKNNPLFARDTLFSVLMIVMGGILGVSLLVGELKRHKQSYNLQGAKTFLSVLIPLAVIALVLPRFTVGGGEGVHPFGEAIFLIVICLLFYGVFIAVQMRSHRNYFISPQALTVEATAPETHAQTRGWPYHTVLFVAYLFLVVLTAKLFALPLNIGLDRAYVPRELGALAVAILVLAPEAMAAISAARVNQMQRSVNIGLGAAFSTVSLSVPAVLCIGLITHHPVFLGLAPGPMVLLLLTFGVSVLTFSGGRTNMLQGLVHIALFLTYLIYIVLIFLP